MSEFTYSGIPKDMVEEVARIMIKMASDETLEEAILHHTTSKKLRLRIINMNQTILIGYTDKPFEIW